MNQTTRWQSGYTLIRIYSQKHILRKIIIEPILYSSLDDLPHWYTMIVGHGTACIGRVERIYQTYEEAQAAADLEMENLS